MLEFTNTLSWDPNDPVAGERFGSYQQLLEWSLDRGLVSRKIHGLLTDRAAQRPDEAAAMCRKAIELRAAIYAIFISYIEDDVTPSAESVAVFDAALAVLPLRIILSKTGADWDWTASGDDFSALISPVVWSAASLLTSPNLAMLRRCAGDRCGWLFVDESRRHNRKWCDMRDCGNRAKARRHYYKHRTPS